MGPTELVQVSSLNINSSNHFRCIVFNYKKNKRELQVEFNDNFNTN